MNDRRSVVPACTDRGLRDSTMDEARAFFWWPIRRTADSVRTGQVEVISQPE